MKDLPFTQFMKMDCAKDLVDMEMERLLPFYKENKPMSLFYAELLKAQPEDICDPAVFSVQSAINLLMSRDVAKNRLRLRFYTACMLRMFSAMRRTALGDFERAFESYDIAGSYVAVPRVCRDPETKSKLQKSASLCAAMLGNYSLRRPGDAAAQAHIHNRVAMYYALVAIVGGDMAASLANARTAEAYAKLEFHEECIGGNPIPEEEARGIFRENLIVALTAQRWILRDFPNPFED